MASYLRSFYFSFLYVVGIIVLSLLMALLLNRKLYLRTASRTMIYLPYVANVVASEHRLDHRPQSLRRARSTHS